MSYFDLEKCQGHSTLQGMGAAINMGSMDLAEPINIQMGSWTHQFFGNLVKILLF